MFKQGSFGSFTVFFCLFHKNASFKKSRKKHKLLVFCFLFAPNKRKEMVPFKEKKSPSSRMVRGIQEKQRWFFLFQALVFLFQKKKNGSYLLEEPQKRRRTALLFFLLLLSKKNKKNHSSKEEPLCGSSCFFFRRRTRRTILQEPLCCSVVRFSLEEPQEKNPKNRFFPSKKKKTSICLGHRRKTPNKNNTTHITFVFTKQESHNSHNF